MKKLLLFAAVLVLTLCFSACGSVEKDDRLLVMIEEGRGFSARQYALRVHPGEDAVFLLTMDRGISLLSADYRGQTQIAEKDGLTELRLLDVRFPARVRLETASARGQIRYEANGGVSGDGSTSWLKSYSLSAHPRANTALGTDLFTREGYTLVCWNTQPNGGGERIGLGSRITLSGGERVLYAQWAQWTPAEEFR